MRKHVFTAIGIFSGLIAGYLVVALIERLTSIIFPYTVLDLDLPQEELEKMLSKIPVEALVMVQLAWIMGVWVGAGVSSYFAFQSRRLAAATVGIILFVAVLFNLFSLPHPSWFVISTLLAYPLFTYIGYRTGKRISGETN